ncbi:hypothetical protein E2C01_038199 [Portunus trituberculatus]|uniref:Uncharacterized protein n=1 Tax=Portunus trituberculatus TaxID=210409 RepID=A0A5B7FGM1_PORTR|nr:hypothetical protein [Portunus trituberculatus]
MGWSLVDWEIKSCELVDWERLVCEVVDTETKPCEVVDWETVDCELNDWETKSGVVVGWLVGEGGRQWAVRAVLAMREARGRGKIQYTRKPEAPTKRPRPGVRGRRPVEKPSWNLKGRCNGDGDADRTRNATLYTSQED